MGGFAIFWLFSRGVAKSVQFQCRQSVIEEYIRVSYYLGKHERAPGSVKLSIVVVVARFLVWQAKTTVYTFTLQSLARLSIRDVVTLWAICWLKRIVLRQTIGVRMGTVLQPHLFLEYMNNWTDSRTFSHLFFPDDWKSITTAVIKMTRLWWWQ